MIYETIYSYLLFSEYGINFRFLTNGVVSCMKKADYNPLKQIITQYCQNQQQLEEFAFN